jgi:hypothetical protein
MAKYAISGIWPHHAPTLTEVEVGRYFRSFQDVLQMQFAMPALIRTDIAFIGEFILA